MLNCDFKVDEKKKQLVITIDLSQRHGLSGSGNTVTIASTQGNQKIGLGDVAIGISCYTKEGLEKLQKTKAEENGYKSWGEYQKAIKAEKAA